jgi:hypothetical protein
MTIAAILPCRGRHEQTVVNVRRLLATAGYDNWRLIAVGGTDEKVLLDALESFGVEVVRSSAPRVTYWQALAGATAQTNPDHVDRLVNLANDLLPGQHWLRRAVAAYDETFGGYPINQGLMGFNGDSHPTEHSCHFLISRALLDHYGGWPVWYDHNFGDTELCQRAIADGVYAKAPYALLFHDHPYFGGVDDAVYAEGRAKAEHDQQLYEQRRRGGWPSVAIAGNGQLSRATNAAHGAVSSSGSTFSAGATSDTRRAPLV